MAEPPESEWEETRAGALRRAALVALAIVIVVNVLLARGMARELVPQLPGGDFTNHVLVMGLLTLLMNLGFASERYRGRAIGIGPPTLFVLLFATAEEISQDWIPSRESSPDDLFASHLGVLAGLLLAWALARRWSVER